MKLKRFYSRRHVEAASFFAQEAKEIEKQARDGIEDREIYGFPRWTRHRSFVVNSIASSFSFVEAAVNEFYDSLLDSIERTDLDDPMKYPHTDLRTYRLISNLETYDRKNFFNLPTLDKYQFILIYSDRPPFDRGRNPYQNMDKIRVLRNYFLHYEPKWEHSGEGLDLTGKEKSLQSLEGKFEQNPLADEHSSFFPEKCLGYGCAKWTFTACIGFVEEFYDRMGSRPPTEDLPNYISLSQRR